MTQVSSSLPALARRPLAVALIVAVAALAAPLAATAAKCAPGTTNCTVVGTGHSNAGKG